MSKSVKLRVMLFFITAVLCFVYDVMSIAYIILCFLGNPDVISSQILTFCVIFTALCVVQAYSLLKVETID